MRWKQTVFYLVLLLTISVLAACGSSSEKSTGAAEEKSNKIVIGWQPSMETQFYLAKDAKIFEENGLEPEYVKFTSGPAMYSALNSGSVDVVYMGGPPAITAMAEELTN